MVKTREEEVVGAVGYIRSLDPRPGRAFGGSINPTVIPDLKVEVSVGKPKVTILDGKAGRLFISPHYRELLTGDVQDEETKRFLRSRLGAAAWFIRALHQRKKTMEKVAAAVFERQVGFLSAGEPGLKPLTMEEVAATVGAHVSTVSRAVAEKYVETPRGVYPFKYFFTGALATEDGGEVAVGRVKSLLEDIIAEEDKATPLSDEELTAVLAARGARVARRTVAKYRHELKIPGKHERKKRI
jgi:RNA polymerase sigma-54 factor